MSTTLLTLHQRLSETIRDWIEEDTTTTIPGTGVTVISTSFNKWDRGKDDYFNDWWLYITEGVNIGVEREVSDYAVGAGQLTVRGANLAAEAGAVTVRLGRYSYAEKLRSINNAIREVYPILYRNLYSTDLVTNNILPNSHFTDWVTTSAPDFYTATNVTPTEGTTASVTRKGGSSVKLVATLANGYLYISSDEYPTLLDLMGKTVTFRVWAYPGIDDDAFIEIYTIAGIKEGEYTADAGTNATTIVDSELDSSVDDYYNGDYLWNSTRNLGALITNYDGATKTLTVAIAGQTNGDIYYINTTQTLTSTTVCPATKWTLLELEDQVLNDDLVKVEFRFKVTTNASTVYFDNARLYGKTMDEYLLPTDFKNGQVSKVFIQASSYSDDPCDDLRVKDWTPVNGFKVYNDGVYQWLQLPFDYESGRQIRLEGTSPLEVLTAATDTISLDNEKIDLLIAYAASDLFSRVEGVPAAEDVGRFQTNAMKWKAKYYELQSRLGMSRPSKFLNMRVY